MKQKRRHWVGISVLLVGVAILVGLCFSLYDLWRRNDILAERSAIVERLARENEALKKERARVESPEFIERLAREKLGLVKEGETVVLMQDMSTEEGDTGASPVLPIWKQWWGLFF